MPNSQEVDTILRAAVSAENVEVLKREIDAGADIEIVRSRTSEEGGEDRLYSLIYIAVFLQKWLSFNFLIVAGANVNSLSSVGTPLLSYAVMRGHVDAAGDEQGGDQPGPRPVHSVPRRCTVRCCPRGEWGEGGG